jgi:hypothetical protein
MSDQLKTIKFTIASSSNLVIIDGLVVPSGSIVQKGIVPFRKWAKNEVSLSLLKQMLGLKKKKVVHEEEEKEDIPVIDEIESVDSSGSSDTEEEENEED